MQILSGLLRHLLKKEPILKKIKKIYDFIFDLTVICPYYALFRPAGVFTFQRKTYRYHLSPYNFTWENERIVEVPIIWQLVKENKGKKILEVGNVLSHYFCVNHDVVDKYERSKGVINEDVADLIPKCRYDLIVSISTFEHIGFDESTKDPDKILHALQNVKKILAAGGRAVITLPLGYNPGLDRQLLEQKLPFDEKHCLRRVSRLNSWTQVNWDLVNEPTYDRPYRFANWLFIGVIKG